MVFATKAEYMAKWKRRACQIIFSERNYECKLTLVLSDPYLNKNKRYSSVLRCPSSVKTNQNNAFLLKVSLSNWISWYTVLDREENTSFYNERLCSLICSRCQWSTSDCSSNQGIFSDVVCPFPCFFYNWLGRLISFY